MRAIAVSFIALIILLVSGCGGQSANTGTTTVVSPTETSLAAAPTNGASVFTLNVGQLPSGGAYLTAQGGRTLYAHLSDSAGKSTCTGACATIWPPLTTTAPPTAASGLSGAVATITSSSGATQVTFNGHPLYFYGGDTSPGQTNGQAIAGWEIATPALALIGLAPTSSSGSGGNYGSNP